MVMCWIIDWYYPHLDYLSKTTKWLVNGMVYCWVYYIGGIQLVIYWKAVTS